MQAPDINSVTAESFVQARRQARALRDYPGRIPGDLDEAYRIQDLAIAQVNDAIAGWKVGRITDEHLPRFTTNRIAGPIFAAGVHGPTDDAPAMPVFAQGFAAAEAEFLLRIGSAPAPGKAGYMIEDAAALIDAVHVGIEIASSPFVGINSLGPAVTASDFGNNNGLVIGAAIPDWRTSGFEHWPVTLSVDGREIGRGTTATMLDGAIGAVRFLLDLLATRGIAVPAGTWVSTGAITGVHEVTVGQEVEARFGDDLRVACRIEAARPA